jgi:hypothetical protein
MSKVVAPGLGQGADNGQAPVMWPMGKVCLTCLNAGWLTEESEAVGKPSRMIRCPECGGASAADRNGDGAVTAMIAREHLKTERIREVSGLPPAGTAALAGEDRTGPLPPPPGFSQADGKVPLLQHERARAAALKQQTANVAKGMKMGGAR